MDGVPSSLAMPFAFGSVALAWSGTWVIGKLGVTAVPPLELNALRFAASAVLLLAIARVTGTPIARRPAGALVASAFFGYCAYIALAFIGLTMAPASDGALIVPTTLPVLTSVTALLIGETLTRAKVVGLVVGSAGAALVIVGGQQGAVDTPLRLTGDLLLLASALCWAIYTTLGAITLRYSSPLAVIATQAPLGALMLLPLAFLEHGFTDLGSWPALAWLDLAYLAVIGVVGSFVVFHWSVRRWGAGRASMTSYLVPVGTLVLAVVFLGERPEPLQYVGGAVILAGVWLSGRRRAPRSAAAVELDAAR